MADIPPLPPGFTLDAQAATSEVPPPPPGFTIDKLAAPRTLTQEAGRQLGLTARAGLEGIVDLAAIPANALAGAMNLGLGAIGVDYRFPEQGGAFSKTLTDAGLPAPETEREMLVNRASRGVASVAGSVGVGSQLAGAGGQVAQRVGSALATRPGMQAASAASGAATAEETRQQGGGAVAQTVAGLAGGMVPYAATEGVKAVARGGRALVEPFYESGRKQVIGRTLNQSATNPTAARQNMGNAAEIVPGSKPTAAEVSKDYGIIAMQRGAKASSPDAFALRSSQQNTARQDFLGAAAKDTTALDTLVKKRDAATAPLRDATFKAAQGKQVSSGKILQQIDTLLADPDNAGQSVQAALKSFRSQIEGKTDARALYAVRKEINRVLEGRYVNADESVLQYAGGQLSKVKGFIDDAISDVAGGAWKSYLKRYAQLSRPIERMEALQNAQQRGAVAATDALTNREVLSQAKWKNQVNALIDSGLLTKGQTGRIRRIQADLDRGMAINDPNIRAIGSNTTQDMTTANVLGQMLGSTKMAPVVRSMARPLQWLYKIPEQELQDLLTEALLDPKLGAELMKNASGAQLARVSSLLRGRFVASGFGTGAAAATQQSRVEADTPQ